MYCPNCGAISQPGARFCYQCGNPLTAEQSTLQVALQPKPVSIPECPAEPAAAKKGSHFIPILILAIMSILGLVLFFLIPLGAGSNPVSSSEIPWFIMEEGTLYFDEAYYDGVSDLTVPEKANGETVQQLSDYCFAYCAEITAVTLPDTLTEIGEYAFAGCSSLRGIEIPESVALIGAHAFEDCTALEAIRIPSGVEEIGSAAFRRCSSLNYIFFDGTYAQWTALYDGKVNPNTTVFCSDGEFPIG